MSSGKGGRGRVDRPGGGGLGSGAGAGGGGGSNGGGSMGSSGTSTGASAGAAAGKKGGVGGTSPSKRAGNKMTVWRPGDAAAADEGGQLMVQREGRSDDVGSSGGADAWNL